MLSAKEQEARGREVRDGVADGRGGSKRRPAACEPLAHLGQASGGRRDARVHSGLALLHPHVLAHEDAYAHLFRAMKAAQASASPRTTTHHRSQRDACCCCETHNARARSPDPQARGPPESCSTQRAFATPSSAVCRCPDARERLQLLCFCVYTHDNNQRGLIRSALSPKSGGGDCV